MHSRICKKAEMQKDDEVKECFRACFNVSFTDKKNYIQRVENKINNTFAIL